MLSLTREELARFLPSQRAIRAWEEMAQSNTDLTQQIAEILTIIEGQDNGGSGPTAVTEASIFAMIQSVLSDQQEISRSAQIDELRGIVAEQAKIIEELRASPWQ